MCRGISDSWSGIEYNINYSCCKTKTHYGMTHSWISHQTPFSNKYMFEYFWGEGKPQYHTSVQGSQSTERKMDNYILVVVLKKLIWNRDTTTVHKITQYYKNK